MRGGTSLAQSGAWAETDKSLTFVGCLKSGGDNAMAKKKAAKKTTKKTTKKGK